MLFRCLPQYNLDVTHAVPLAADPSTAAPATPRDYVTILRVGSQSMGFSAQQAWSPAARGVLLCSSVIVQCHCYAFQGFQSVIVRTRGPDNDTPVVGSKDFGHTRQSHPCF